MWYRYQDFNVERVIKSAPVEFTTKRGKNARDYLQLVTAFDTETTTLRINGEDHAIMYIWQWAFEGDVVFGRYWWQFEALCNRIVAALPARVHLKVWVHNLSYDFCGLKGILHFQPEDVFCVSKRRILRADWGPIEFACSYLHSGLSLNAWLKEVNAPHRKQSGEKYNYAQRRYPWTPLTKRELTYCAYDVLGVVDAIHIEMQRDGDTLCTIPGTKTGYVRRIVKKAIKENVSYTLMRDIQPGYDLYKLLRAAFRGGDTHASRFYTGRVVDNVHHVDRSSSYPDEIVNRTFPMTRFVKVENPDMSDVLSAIKHKKAVLLKLRMRSVHLRRPWRTGCPYIPVDTCTVLVGAQEDNGRVLSAEVLEIAVTDIDFRIICRQYDTDKDTDMEILEMWSARYAPLPEPVRAIARELYIQKTTLKGVKDKALIYALYKAMINSLYGMTAQDPGKPLIVFKQSVNPDEDQFQIDTTKTQQKLVEEYAHKAFLPYQIGVWVTAWARYDLAEGVRALDELPCDAEGRYPADFLYCDTDSIFYRGSFDWTAYNTERRERSKANGACAQDRKGVWHYMGEMESDPREECRRFATMGAKKYAWQDMNGTLHITIAGVVKDKGARELDRLGGLDKFVDQENPPLFVEAGGTTIKYNDNVHFETVIDGHPFTVTDNAVIQDSTYQMKLVDEYARLLTLIENNIHLIEFMGEF